MWQVTKKVASVPFQSHCRHSTCPMFFFHLYIRYYFSVILILIHHKWYVENWSEPVGVMDDIKDNIDEFQAIGNVQHKKKKANAFLSIIFSNLGCNFQWHL